jgi:tripartite-type tricarboxylate transporter receptor subunit TctC
MVIAVRPDSPFKTLADLVAAARTQPGKLNYGHQGAGSIPHLSMEEFLETAKLDIKGIPSRGDPAVVTDLLGGSIDVAALVQGTVAGQNLRLLGIFAEERHPSFADTPTVREQGFDVAPISFGGLLAPAATPKTSSASSRPHARSRPKMMSMRVRPSVAVSRRATMPTAPSSARGLRATSRPRSGSSSA